MDDEGTWPEERHPEEKPAPRAPGLKVEAVAGRYPHRPRVLKTDNIVAEVIEAGPNRFVIRLEDTSDETVWFHIEVRVG